MKTFIHIPKTGGTTMVHTLSRQILFNKFKRLNPKRTTHPKEFLNKVENLLEDVIKSKSNIEVVGGHFGFGAHPAMQDPKLHFTVLREPIDRVISEYYYMKYKGMYYQDLIEKEELSLLDYVNHEETSYLNNLQTRLVAGESYGSGEEVTEQVYVKALDNLKKFASFGITEQMSNSLALFYLNLNWKRLPYYIESNINDQRPNRKKASQEDIDAITQRDKYDVLLYQEAKKIFNERVLENEDQIKKLSQRILNPSPIYKFLIRVLSKAKNR